MSHRSHLSSASGDQTLEHYKHKCRELEQKQRTAHENARTLSATLNETQLELENLVNDHQQLAQECAQQINQIEQLNHTLQTNQRLIEDLRAESRQAEADAERLRAELSQVKKELTDRALALDLQVS